MKVEYLGHSSFKLTESTEGTIITDPYAEVGYDMPERSADIVTISHGHRDHNAVSLVKGKPIIIDKEGIYDKQDMEILAVKTFHDEVEGQKRGENLIFKYRMDGLDICHLGDIGHECDADLLEMIVPVNVLFIPVGGNFTIDAETAKDYVDKIMPEIVIPMHYKTKDCELDIEKPDEFLELFDDDQVEISDESEIEFSREDLDTDVTKVILLKKAQD